MRPIKVARLAQAAGSVAVPALRTGLISFWEFEEGSGAGSYVDAVAGVNNLVPSGTITQVTGIVNKGAQSASGAFLKKTSPIGLSFPSSAFTVAGWFNTAIFNLGLVSKYDIAGNAREWSLLDETGYPTFTVSVDGTDAGRTTAVCSSGITVNVWQFIVGWRSLTDDKIYIQRNDGTPYSATFSHTNTVFTGSTEVDVASLTPTGIYAPGLIVDQCGVWSRELTAAERTQLYNSGAGLAYSAM